jgi:hypothetical protein
MARIGIMPAALGGEFDVGILVKYLDRGGHLLRILGKNDTSRLEAVQQLRPVLSRLGPVLESQWEEEAIGEGLGDFFAGVERGGAGGGNGQVAS